MIEERNFREDPKTREELKAIGQKIERKLWFGTDPLNRN
jgi:hypothetical protein